MGFKIKAPSIKIPVKISNPIATATDYLKNPGHNIGKEFSNAGKNLLGVSDAFTFGGAGALSKQFIGKKPNAPSAGEDPNVTALRNRLYGEASDFEQGLGNAQKNASNQIEQEGSLALGQGLKDTRQNFNRRGLLYSGMREGGEQDVRGRVASTMASQKAQSNADLDKMASAKYQKAAQVGLQGYQDAVNREAEIAGVNLQNQVARAQMMQQIGQLGGQMAGSYYGNRSPSSTPTSSGPMVGDYGNQYRQGNLAADSYYA